MHFLRVQNDLTQFPCQGSAKEKSFMTILWVTKISTTFNRALFSHKLKIYVKSANNLVFDFIFFFFTIKNLLLHNLGYTNQTQSFFIYFLIIIFHIILT